MRSLKLHDVRPDFKLDPKYYKIYINCSGSSSWTAILLASSMSSKTLPGYTVLNSHAIYG